LRFTALTPLEKWPSSDGCAAQTQDPCLVGMEACATAHHWAREPIGLGHEAKFMPPAHVKASVKRNRNDAADRFGGRHRGRQRDRGHCL